ncbi:MAG: LysM peptidoglycan-binding domain-containing protein [Smithellaceae bacterium]|nr:LysM peptidoglycan-binding domain-containing protein [Smithellaceae bacterium]
MSKLRLAVTVTFILILNLALFSANTYADATQDKSTGSITSPTEKTTLKETSKTEDSISTMINAAEEKTGPEGKTDQDIVDDKDISAVVNGKDLEHKEEQDIMENALDLLNESQSAWIKGDIEKAVDLLDEAYTLILDADGDPDIARQKDDLRLLIAKRIMAIYRSREGGVVTNGTRSEVPVISNADVEKEIRMFQSTERDFFVESYKRSALFRPIILRELRKAGLPEELSWLPLVESGFKICALSRARALGLWQFIPSTGYKFGLSRDEWIDERMDVEKSTRAAISYLKELHAMFGDWLTVLAAYNCGEGRVLRVISGQHINYLDRFWDLYRQLPYETARYVPRFLATVLIIKDPKKYGFEDIGENIERQNTYVYDVVKSNKCMKLEDIAQKLEISGDSLSNLNSELRLKVTPDREYDLKVPPGNVDRFAQAAADIPQWEQPKPEPRRSFASVGKYRSHRVRRGETLASIARKYGVSVRALRVQNHISGRGGVRVGRYIRIPGGHKSYASADDADEKGTKNQSIRYKVKKGDTLTSLARRFETTPGRIKSANKIRGNNLRAGQVLKISPQAQQEAGTKKGG